MLFAQCRVHHVFRARLAVGVCACLNIRVHIRLAVRVRNVARLCRGRFYHVMVVLFWTSQSRPVWPLHVVPGLMKQAWCVFFLSLVHKGLTIHMITTQSTPI